MPYLLVDAGGVAGAAFVAAVPPPLVVSDPPQPVSITLTKSPNITIMAYIFFIVPLTLTRTRGRTREKDSNFKLQTSEKIQVSSIK